MKRTLTGLLLVLFIIGNVIAPVSIGLRASSAGIQVIAHSKLAEAVDNSSVAKTGKNVGELNCDTLNIFCGLVKFTTTLFLFIPQFVLTMTGLIFDWALHFTLSSQNYKQNMNGFIEMGWKILRDISNIIFIFTLMIAAFSLILGMEGSILGIDPKRAVIWVIVMALLINFSLFFSKIVIDVGNVLGRAFYSQLNPKDQIKDPDQVSITDPAFVATKISGGKSVSLQVLAHINPQAAFMQKIGTSLADKQGWELYIAYIAISMLTFLFDIFLIYLFATLGLLFLARTVDLWMGMIMAPLAFSLYAIPSAGFMERFKFQNWLSELVKSALLVPVFLFFLYIAILAFRVNIDIPSENVGNGSFAIIGIMIPIFIKSLFIGFILIQGRKIATEMAGTVGKFVAEKAAGTIGGVAQFAAGATTAGLAFAGRSTLGKAAQDAAMKYREKGEDMEKNPNNYSGFSKFANRMAYKTTARIGRSTFDPRNNALYDKTQELTKAGDFDIGKWGAGGGKWNADSEYRKRMVAKAKAAKATPPVVPPTTVTPPPATPPPSTPTAKAPTPAPAVPPTSTNLALPQNGGGANGATGNPQLPPHTDTPKGKEPHEVLGVDKHATEEQARTAWRQVMKDNRAAMDQDTDKDAKEKANRTIQEATEAFDKFRDNLKTKGGTPVTETAAPKEDKASTGTTATPPATPLAIGMGEREGKLPDIKGKTGVDTAPNPNGGIHTQTVNIGTANFTNLHATTVHSGQSNMKGNLQNTNSSPQPNQASATTNRTFTLNPTGQTNTPKPPISPSFEIKRSDNNQSAKDIRDKLGGSGPTWPTQDTK